MGNEEYVSEKEKRKRGDYFKPKSEIQRKEILKSLKINEDERLEKWRLKRKDKKKEVKNDNYRKIH